MKLAVIFHRFGPYHYARLQAAAKMGHVTAIEYVLKDDTYSWDIIKTDNSFERITLFDIQGQFLTLNAIQQRIAEVFNQIKPDVVAIPGWGNQWSLIFLRVCLETGTPTILMSDSTWHDFTRKWWLEKLKSRIVRLFSIALVSGRASEEYLGRLGYSSTDSCRRIFHSYDVVDNEHFQNGADYARQTSSAMRKILGLPDRYFLASGRFVEKKNHLSLIHAYKIYLDKAKEGPWKMVLLGDGPMLGQITNAISENRLTDRVILPGFKQYNDLPTYYGLAGAFIHPSLTEQWGLVVNEAMAAGLPVIVSNFCGCVEELVHEGVNGFTFDPHDVATLARLMIQISSDTCDLGSMGMESKRIVSEWTPNSFAENLWTAAKIAHRGKRSKCSFADKFLLKMLIQRMR